ncbi:MAG: DUF503 domain-containing protein [Anaerolineae bacterium]|nr:DUF503 domain-containing protein [Anaerolineae bacterium]
MVIATCRIKLYLPTASSLKGKRSILKSVISRVGREFNVSIAEVDYQDVWQTALLGVAAVSNDAAYAHGQLTRVVGWIERNRPDVEILDYSIEML